MNKRYLLISAVWVLLCCVNLHAENIDPNNDDSQFAYGENVGWLNFEPNTGDGVQVAFDKLTGFIWAENIGWINLSCENTDYCGTVDFGVINDGLGNLSGFAWAENVGWINFNPTNGGVTIDSEGNFSGFAWGENIGWINFDSTDLYGYGVLACKVNYIDLGNFVDDWLESGNVPGNLNDDRDVDLEDYSILASYWLGYCPDDWPLK